MLCESMVIQSTQMFHIIIKIHKITPETLNIKSLTSQLKYK